MLCAKDGSQVQQIYCRIRGEALNAAEAINERYNVEVFKKALKLYREHLVRTREEVRAVEAAIKDMEERMMPTESRWCL